MFVIERVSDIFSLEDGLFEFGLFGPPALGRRRRRVLLWGLGSLFDGVVGDGVEHIDFADEVEYFIEVAFDFFAVEMELVFFRFANNLSIILDYLLIH